MARLGDYVNIKAGKLDANAASEDGQYPFFTCAITPLRIDSYSYDCECVLVAGNGDLNVKYYSGKFNAYQRTYIIESKNKNSLSLRYLYYFLEQYVETLRKESIGGVIKYIKLGNLTEATIPLPPLEEQRRIAALLDKVSDLIAKRRAQMDKLDLLVKARFVEMFERGSYPKVKASEICDFITKGTTPSAEEIFTENSPSRIPFLKVYNLSFTGELLFEQNPQYIERNVHEGKLSRSKVYPNDVLMNIVGPPLGKFALIPKKYGNLNINQAIAIFRAKEKILPKFLLAALMQPEVLKPFMDQAVGVRQQNLSLEQCRNLEISLPDIELQKQFVKFEEQVEKSKLTIQQSLDKLEILKRALMQQYFG